MKFNDYLVQHGKKSELARLIGVSPVLITQWSLEQRPVPPVRCVAIERATHGAVSRMDLRPDDWHEIWPELAQPSAERSCAAIEPVAVQGAA